MTRPALAESRGGLRPPARWLNVAVVGAAVLGGTGLAVIALTDAPVVGEPPVRFWRGAAAPCYYNCGRTATVNISINRHGLFDHKQVCDTHAQQAAWEADQNGYPYKMIDIETGRERADLKDSRPGNAQRGSADWARPATAIK
jgi:hypothetical protein